MADAAGSDTGAAKARAIAERCHKPDVSRLVRAFERFGQSRLAEELGSAERMRSLMPRQFSPQ